MQRLFLFLYQYRAFLTFLFLEILCSWMIIRNNDYQGVKFFNSSNRLAAGILQTSTNISDYFDLVRVNKNLAEENAALKEDLERLHQSLYSLGKVHPSDSSLNGDSLFLQQEGILRKDSLLYDEVQELDSVTISKFKYISAKVINNSTRRFDNYITINKGEDDGVEPGMGAISNDGVVGIVKATSKHFSVITSILHSNIMISAKIERTGDLATVVWGGKDPYTAQLDYVPRHVKLQANDTIVTSGYNAIFPEGIPIGFIKEVEIREDATFYDISITLASDLNELSYVYLIRNTMAIEQDSLETTIHPF